MTDCLKCLSFYQFFCVHGGVMCNGRGPALEDSVFNTDRRIEIREVTTAEERERVYRFRYKVYVEEMKRLQQYADHDKKEICEPLCPVTYWQPTMGAVS